MNRDFELALEEATCRLEQGETVEGCLAHYPGYADRLEPLLRMAAFSARALDYVEPPSEAAMAAGKRRLLLAAQRKPAPQPRRFLSLFPLPMKGLATAALVMLLLVVVGGGFAVASVSSLPGDFLYPVKLASEQARLLLTFDIQARDQLQVEFAQERRAEVIAILEAGRRVSARFEGTLESFDDVVWIVSGLEVTLDADTPIEGNPVVGATVAVEALAPGDGSLLAIWLAVDGRGEMPKPTVTRTPMMTLQPMATPRPTGRLTGTSMPTMMPSPTGTYTSYPTKTCGPESTDTLHPTDTHEPEPSCMPHPTETREPEPTQTPHPTETHEPEPPHTPHPTETHKPEPPHTPHMTRTPHH
jgi:hypothetical protein